MLKSTTNPSLAACLLRALASTALAGGFSIYEAGARATGMGCAVTASVADGSALFYNVAGLSFMPGTQADVNVMPVAPHIKFAGLGDPFPSYTAETVTQSFIIPGVGVSHNPGGKLAFGLGVSAPFGLGVEWKDPDTYSGRFHSYDVDLATIYITPAVSYKVTPRLALAAGLDVAYQHIQLNRRAGQAFGGNAELVDVLDVQLEGDSDLNFTPTFGLMYKPSPKVSLGVMYHHKKTMTYKGGTGTLTSVAPAGPLQDAVAPLVGEYDVDTELGLPHILSLGIAYRLTDRLLAEFDAVQFGWSNFEELALDFDPNPGGALSSVVPMKYEDKWQFRLGLDYAVNERWSLLAGYARDESPQPKAGMGALLPDANRNDFSFGAQYVADGWRFTASFMAVLNEARDNLENGRVTLFPEDAADPEAVELRNREAGRYESVANIWAFGIGRQF
ncbi:MAG: outer membrane protein transport protein [Candidatus Krumholzibacteriia bacterium]